jgi:hypothetical protein
MCLHWPNLRRFDQLKDSLRQLSILSIYVDADVAGASNGSSWKNAYICFIEFQQYPDFFAYDTMKAGSLRRYFDGLTVLHIAYR